MSLALTQWRGEGANPSRSAWFIHGIMGSQRNWRSFAKDLADRHPGWETVTIDLRNHGASGVQPGGDGLKDCAADLRRLAAEIGAPALVSGHSFGGKVALEYAKSEAPGLESLLVLDCPPGQTRTDISDAGEGELARVLGALETIELPLARRGQVIEELTEKGLSRSLASWMSTNLVRDPARGGGYVWAFDLDAIRRMIEDYWAHDFLPYLEGDESRGDARFQFVRAERSDRWTDAEWGRLTALSEASESFDIAILADAGHWLHVDQPEALAELFRGAFEAL